MHDDWWYFNPHFLVSDTMMWIKIVSYYEISKSFRCDISGDVIESGNVHWFSVIIRKTLLEKAQIGWSSWMIFYCHEQGEDNKVCLFYLPFRLAPNSGKMSEDNKWSSKKRKSREDLNLNKSSSQVHMLALRFARNLDIGEYKRQQVLLNHCYKL